MKILHAKKILACFMATILVISCLSAGPVSACPDIEVYTYDDFEYEVMTDYDDDYNEYQYICIINYTGNSAHVEIPSAIDGLPVADIAYKAFCNNEAITSVCVPSSVTSIEDYAFDGCTNLSEINLPSTLTYIGDNILNDTAYAAENYEDGVLYWGQYLLYADSKSLPEKVTVKEGTALISAYAFFSCDITSVNLPSSLRKINDSAFAFCEKLTDVDIAEGVEEFGYGIFSDCYSLAEISLPSTLKIIGAYCFGDCKKLTALELPENMEEIPDGLLYGCESITSFDINDNISSIGYESFAGTGIKSMHIPASVNYIRSLGYSTALENITVDSKNEIYFAKDNVLFEKYFVDNSIRLIRIGCNKSLENYIVPDDVVTIDYGALRGNYTLKNLTLGKNVKSIYDFEAPALENIYVHPENETFTSVDGVLLSNNGTTLEYYPIGKTDAKYTVPAGITTIGSGCFVNNPYLTELTIPTTVKELRHTVVESCENLTTINMSPCEASYSWPFLFCDKLTTINFAGAYNDWLNMDIECYNDSTNGIYLYCNDGTIELQAPEEDEYTEPTETTPSESTTSDPVEDNTGTTPPVYLGFETGDVNMDYKVNIRDVTAIQKYLAKLLDLDENSLELADFTEDNNINIKDATAIQKKIAGLI